MAFNCFNRADDERFVALNFYGNSPDSNVKTISNSGDKETESIDCFRYRMLQCRHRQQQKGRDCRALKIYSVFR